MKKKLRSLKNKSAFGGLLLCMLSVAVIISNLAVMYRSAKQQNAEMGNARLQQISDQMQKTLDDSKIMLLRFASDVEVFIERKTEQASLQSYLTSQSRIFRDQSQGTFMNAYVCTPEWILISDSPVPNDYVLAERDWYSATIKTGIDHIYTSAPYVDAFTGDMCFTTSILLSDGTTVAAIDYNLAKIREFVSEMNASGNGEALIVSRDGVIVGYTDRSLIGEKIDQALPGYLDIYTRLLSEQNDSLIVETTIDGTPSQVFCNRSGEWLLLYKAGRATLFTKTYLWLWISLALSIALLFGMFFFFLSARRHLQKAREAFDNRESLSEDRPVLAHEPLKQELNAEKQSGDSQKEKTVLTKRTRDGIMAVLLATILMATVFTGFVLVGWGNDRMEREVDSYNYQLENWTNNQLQTLNMFVDTIAANPAVLEDYDFAVSYLDQIVRNYSEISAAYIARPGNEHEMTMNNGWVPNADYVVAERQWYQDTQNSKTGISISAPYLDARTGLYCVTFSRVVYHAQTGEQIGIFALDFYIGNLTGIMESGYSSTGYAFLVDNNNVIVNHPNADYQISDKKSINIVGTEYDVLLNNSDIHLIWDYDGKLKVCISRTDDVTGFTVVSVKDAYIVYGIVLLGGFAFILLLLVCIILLYQMIMRTIRWQEAVRARLTEEAERASRADRAKSSFLAQMSHEIRTPINAVLGMNEMILRESKEDAVIEYASNAYNAGKALLSIINDILDISKIEAGKFEIVEADYDLYSLISDCYHLTADRVQKKGLKFLYHVEEDLPARFSGDMFHIRQIVVNFLTNSIKYTDEGSIELRFSGREENDRFLLCISVKDTGIGLTEESLGKLFTSFQRFDLKRNQSVEGTGLGLSICKQLAELMGGEVSAESVYGQGSVFYCRIPQKVVDAAPVGKLNLEQPTERKFLGAGRSFTAETARILVVDDVEMNLMVFTSLLKGHHLQIDEALSGKQCLELVEKQSYDLIFMDHMMPEMDGMETYARMQQMEHQNPDTPVIMLTANAISGEKEKYLAAGFASYLTKPIQSDKLDELLLSYLPKEKITWVEDAPAPEAGKLNGGDAGSAADGHTGAIDCALGLSFTGGSMDAYLQILDSYLRHGEARARELKELAADALEEHIKDYVTQAHALKSTSMTIGARELSEAAKELEAAGKSGDCDTIRRKNDALLELFGNVLKEGNEILAKRNLRDGVEAGPLPELSKEELQAYQDRIREAADGYDSDELLAACRELLGYSYRQIALAEKLKPVCGAAEDFEYEKAAELAEQIFEELFS